MTQLAKPYTLNASCQMKNRIALAPMTNTQSHPDGRASQAEMEWLERRAQGGFGLVITCASHVNRWGQGWPGQMGIFDDELLPGLKEVAESIKRHGSLGMVQLHHGGLRAPKELTGRIPKTVVDVAPNKAHPDGAKALTSDEIESVMEDFTGAAVRAERAGFQGIQLHAAHGYMLSQFFDRHLNRRSDQWGETFDNRVRVLVETIRRIKHRVTSEFVISVRFSPENYGSGGFYPLAESFELIDCLIEEGVDLLDASLWDVFKVPEDPDFQNTDLITAIASHVNDRKPLMVAGKIWTIEDAHAALDRGADFIALGRVAIGNPDWPQALAGQNLELRKPPFSPVWLAEQKLGEKFIQYLRRWPNFVSKE